MCEEMKVLPCPFCQSEDLRYVPSGWIKCNHCGTRGPIDDVDWTNDKEKAAEKRAWMLWSTRHEPEVTKEQIEELLDSFVETEHVYYGMAIDCIMAGKTERLANELFELVSSFDGIANNGAASYRRHIEREENRKYIEQLKRVNRQD